MSEVVVTVLPVGQGAMNLIEVYDDCNALVNLSLIDCGTDRTTPARFDKLDTPVRESVEYVAEKMRERFCNQEDVFLDNVLFTHRDSDHWTLFDSLWEALFGQSTVVVGSEGCQLRYGMNIMDDGTEEEFLADLSVSMAKYRRTMCCPEKEGYWSDFHCTLFFLDDREEIKMKYEDGDGRYILTITFSMTESDFNLYDNKTNKMIINVALKEGSEGEGAAEGIIIGQQRVVKLSDAYPEDYKQKALFWKDFGNYVAESETGMEMLKQLNYFFGDLSFLDYTSDDIIEWLEEYDGVERVIGSVLVGGSMQAGHVNGGRDSGVKEMLRRAELLSGQNVIELARGYSYELGDMFVLSILERLELNTLGRIKIARAKSAGNSAIKKNATSAVSSLESNEIADFPKFIFTGDATIHTFYAMYCSEVFAERKNAVWTAPHHGSWKTINGMLSKEEDLPLFPILLNEFDPHTAIISAGFENRHGHPNLTFVQWMRNYLNEKKKKGSRHLIYYNSNDESAANWNTGIIDENLFTILEDSESGLTAQMHCFAASLGSYAFSHTQEGIVINSLNAEKAAANSAIKESVKTGKPEFAVPHADLFFRRH